VVCRLKEGKEKKKCKFKIIQLIKHKQTQIETQTQSRRNKSVCKLFFSYRMTSRKHVGGFLLKTDKKKKKKNYNSHKSSFFSSSSSSSSLFKFSFFYFILG
jgi:hypothetical protein